MLNKKEITNLYLEIAPAWLQFLETEKGKIEQELARLTEEPTNDVSPSPTSVDENEKPTATATPISTRRPLGGLAHRRKKT